MAKFNRCPGMEQLKSLKSITCKCECGSEVEIFSDEIDKKVKCDCGKTYDFSQLTACEVEAFGGKDRPS